MTLKSKGVLIPYSKSKDLDYARLAELSARLAEHYLGVPASVVEVQPVQTQVRWFKYEHESDPTRVEWNNSGRYQAFDISPYDETLLLDSDYFIQHDGLANWFGSDHDFVCHNNSWDVTGQNQFAPDRFVSANGFEMRWATVVYFKKNAHSERIFETWRNVHRNYAYYSNLLGFMGTPFRNDYAMSIAHQVCNGYANIGTIPYGLPALSTTDSVLDYNDRRWLLQYRMRNQKWNVIRYTGDLHAMNKPNILQSEIYTKLWNSV